MTDIDNSHRRPQVVASRRWAPIGLALLGAYLPAAVAQDSDTRPANDCPRTFYLDARHGSDTQDGFTPETSWQTLDRAGRVTYRPGDRLMLRRGCTFSGTLLVRANGNERAPVIIDAWQADAPEANLPRIDARDRLAAIHISDSRHVEIRNLTLTADGGERPQPEARTRRYGVLITTTAKGSYAHIHLNNLYIHDIFASESVSSEGPRPTSNMGMGIGVIQDDSRAALSDVCIENCRIERTGHTGIKLAGNRSDAHAGIDGVRMLNNRLTTIGGPGIQPSRCRRVLVRGNTVDGSGSSRDPRMHGRGSGIWPWGCQDVLIEKNRFMHARGLADSCGAHIDFNCRDVVVQYNLSLDNEGGFVEILGNNHNCAYRYNISINDGFRVKGRGGAKQEGKTLWTSGYVGRKQTKTGPINSYIYNNTIFTGQHGRACFSFGGTTDGILIANNIFYILGDRVAAVAGDQDQRPERAGPLERVCFTNNLYLRENLLPRDLPIDDSQPFTGDPGFKNPGGSTPADYIPTDARVVKDRGIPIAPLAGDAIGLRIGLEVKEDFLGRPITGRPDLGAIEFEEPDGP
jgi:hypothetical protein